MGRWLGIAGLWLVAATPAFGQSSSLDATAPRAPLPLELDWRAPRECPTGSDVRAELERIARARPGFSLRPLAASARVQRRGTGYQVTLRTEHEGRRGERTLEASECKTLVRTVTLVLALAFGAGVELEPSAEEPADGAGSSAPAEPAAAPAPAFAETASDPGPAANSREPVAEPNGPGPALSLGWLLGLGGTANLMPRAGLLASTGPELRVGALSLGMRVLFWPNAATEAGPNIQAHWRAIGGALQACGHMSLAASLGLAACGGGRVVAMRAYATGNVRGATATAPWTALTSAVSLDWPSTHWLRARVELSLSLSLSRPTFIIEDLATTHRVPLLIPEATASALTTF